MPVTRYHDKEFSGRSKANFTYRTPEEKHLVDLPFAETRLLLATLGVISCRFHHPYWPSSDVRTSNYLYCVAVYAAASINAAWTGVLKIQQYGEKGSANVKARNCQLMQLIALLPHILGVVLWVDTHAHSKCMECFIDIQEKFNNATGKQLAYRRRRMERCSIAFLGIFPLVSLLIFQKYILDIRIEETSLIAFVYSHLLLVLIHFYWIGMSLSLTDAFDDAKSPFEWQLANNQINSQSIFHYRLLWLSLRSGMDCIWNAFTPTVLHLTIFVLAISLMYEAANFVQMRQILAAFGTFSCALIFIGHFSLTCIISDRTQRKMKVLVDDILPKVMLSSHSIGTQREIVILYLAEKARPAVCSFRGLTVVNKSLILSFLSNFATYIIVLFQLAQRT